MTEIIGSLRKRSKVPSTADLGVSLLVEICTLVDDHVICLSFDIAFSNAGKEKAGNCILSLINFT